ncbi:hypothetical protein GIB67_019759 [Kingdonia uniflora]|uniref:Glucan endo-1,3-beta-D-glucosidase n=1 Tax=Kingdonia uniflora TaxID=39325 RepID=A0A7J7MK22_9MAGN|nr:hypothetical protein GIB67_019759 [Kingdonia uniflora]
MVCDNLLPPNQVISLLRSKNIKRVLLFTLNHDVLLALRGPGIEVVLGTLNEDLPRLGSDLSFAQNWVQTNVAPYVRNNVHFRYISAGNEVIPSELAENVLPAMKNLDLALKGVNIVIPVTTAISTAGLGTSYPLSAGAFSESVIPIMGSIASFLAETNSPLLVNVYSYFAYIYNQADIWLDYALLTSNQIIVSTVNSGTSTYSMQY